MSKSREKSNICALCGDYCKSVEHHLVFGSGLRELADEDDLIIDLCIDCHTLAFRTIDRIHDNVAAERLSKMLGQMMYERNAIAKMLVVNQNVPADEMKYVEDTVKNKVRQQFLKRYGRSFL